MSIAYARHVELGGELSASEFTRLVCVEDLAKQSDKDGADINVIMRRYVQQGMLPMSRQIPFFADISEVGSLQEAMAVMDEAERVFAALDADTRKAFGNDPRVFVAAAQDPAAEPLFAKLGLMKVKAAPPVEGAASGTV